MKTKITKGILLAVLPIICSIYLITEVGLTVPISILILITNVVTLVTAGFYIKKTIDDNFRNPF